MFTVILIISVLFSAAAFSITLKLPAVKGTTSNLARVVLDPLPIIYNYDHCPYCVRVRLAFGLKNVKHNLVFLANDDVATPTALVGKKIAPIFQFGNEIMPESMDIIERIDGDAKFGPTNIFLPASSRTDIKDWQASVKEINSIAQRPRYVAPGTMLPEFATRDGREAFVYNHPVPPYKKPEWKNDLNSEERWTKYQKAYETSAQLIDKVNESLVELDKLVHCETHCTEGGLSYDDIDLWSRLRSLTILKGIQWPTKLRAYMEHLSVAGDVPLYDQMAC